MWFSYVHSDNKKYRIGYAESLDGNLWTRKDNLAGIDIGGEFTRDMICYPCVFKLNARMYMVYNGDNYGKEGFGLAIWE
jgi:hypothetical protein